MRIRLFILLLLIFIPSISFSATYYVRTDGHDTSCNGTADADVSAAPNCAFLTVQKGVDTAQPADTVLIGAGDYSTESITTKRSGTDESNRIVIDGQTASDVTIKRFVVNGHQYITLQNITVKGYAVANYPIVSIAKGSHYFKLLHSIIDLDSKDGVYGVKWDPPTTNPFGDGDGTTPASYCTIHGNILKNAYQCPGMIWTFGDYNTIDGNEVKDLATGDFLKLWGRYHTVSNNSFHGSDCVGGGDCVGTHPDFVQTYGNNCWGSMGHIIENNLIKDIKYGQISQLSADLLTDTITDWTFRNNIFMDVSMQSSTVIPGLKFYNNIFYRCNYLNGGNVFSVACLTGTARCGYSAGTYCANDFKIFNNIFLANGDFRNTTGWYYFYPTVTGQEADYNYVGKFAYTAVNKDLQEHMVNETDPPSWGEWWEDHGINGGDPKFVNAPKASTWAVWKGHIGDYDMETTTWTSSGWQLNGTAYYCTPTQCDNNIVNDGTFNTSCASWTYNDTYWSCSGARMKKDADGTGTLSQSAGVGSGQTYTVIMGVYNFTAGSFTTSIGGSTPQTETFTGGGATITQTHITTGSDDLIITPSNDARFDLDYVYVYSTLSTAEKSSEQAHGGTQSLYLSGNKGSGIYHYEYLNPSGRYNASSWVYVVSGQVSFKVLKGTTFQTIATSSTTGSWEQLTSDFTADSTTGSYYVSFVIESGSAELYADDVVITIKDHATTTIQFQENAESFFTLGEYIEIADDGVARQITDINTTNNVLTFTPALSSSPDNWGVSIDCWGTNNTNMTLDLKLAADSPLRGVGKDLSSVWIGAKDINGVVRPQGGTWDIGPYEYDEGETTTNKRTIFRP